MHIDEEKTKYVLEHFIRMYSNLDIKDLDIGYSKKNRIKLIKSNISIENPLDKPFIINRLGKNLPLFYESKCDKPIQYLKNQTIIGFDLFKNVFLFISGIIELSVKSKRDLLGRFIYSDSFQEKHGIIEFPIVNYYFSILEEAVKNTYKIDLITKSESFSVGLTHDIDKCNSGWLEDGFYLLKKWKFSTFLKLQFRKWILSKDNWFNFNDILSEEKFNSITSTFFFLVKKGKINKHYNADYFFNTKNLKKVYAYILNNGSEIGLHGSFGSYLSNYQFQSEINMLNKVLPDKEKVKGNRFHFLCWDQEITSHVIEESQLSYDMSAAYPDHFGFKTGFCFPSQYYNFKKNKPYSFFEVPLILMDATVYEEKYMNLQGNDTFDILHNMIKESIKFHGIFTLLWHNNYYTQYKYSGKLDLLWRIIKICKQYDAKFLTIKQIVEEWKQSD